jgi:hypothetical protein
MTDASARMKDVWYWRRIMNKKKKVFDCITMKRELQRKFYEETKDLNPQELIAHIQRKVENGPFGKLWKQGSAARRNKSVA